MNLQRKDSLLEESGGTNNWEATDAAFSSDGVYLALCGSNFISTFKKENGVYKKTSPVDFSNGNMVNGCCLSPDGKYLVTASASPPYACFYKFNEANNRYERIYSVENPVANTHHKCSFSGDGNYVALAHYAPPFHTVYKRNGDAFTRITPCDYTPGSVTYGCGFSPNSKFVCFTGGAAGRGYMLYSLENDILTKVEKNPVVPSGEVRGGIFSKNGEYLAFASTSSPFLHVYKIDEFGNQTLLDINQGIPNVSSLLGVDFSKDSDFLIASGQKSGVPVFNIYNIVNDKLELIEFLHGINSIGGTAGKFSPDGKVLVLGFRDTDGLKCFACFDTGTAVLKFLVKAGGDKVLKYDNGWQETPLTHSDFSVINLETEEKFSTHGFGTEIFSSIGSERLKVELEGVWGTNAEFLFIKNK